MSVASTAVAEILRTKIAFFAIPGFVEVLAPDHDRPPSGAAVAAQREVRTQTCMNLCEVDLVIVKLGVS
jgi:hypothetical protein